MLAILIQWGGTSLFLWAAALIAWRRTRGISLAMDMLSLLLLKMLLVSGMIMLTGLAGQLTADKLAMLSAAGWLAIGLFGRQELRRAVQQSCRSVQVLKAAAARRPLQAALLAGVFFLLLARMAAHVWFLPPYIHDVNTYHLPRVAEWIQRGDLTVPHLPVKRVYWPAGFELLQTWWAVFPHHDAVVEAAGVPFYAMAIGAVFVLGRSLGLRLWTAAWCSVLFAFTPALVLNATSSKNDIAIAALYLYLAALWSRPLHRRLTDRRWLLTLIAICLGIGIKPTMVFIAPGLCWLAFAGMRKSDIAIFKKFTVAVWLGTIAALAILLGAYWYVRNWIQFGNPFYPTSLRVADQLIAGSAGADGGQQGAFSLASAAADWHLLWTRKIYDAGGAYNPDLPFMTGWGWFVFSCGAGVLIWAVTVNNRLRWVTLTFLTSFFLLFGWVTADPWNMRFAQWFPAIAALGFGVTIQHSALLGMTRQVMIMLAFFATALNGLGIIGNGYMRPEEWLAFIKTPVSQRTLKLGGVIRQKSLDQRIPSGELVAFITDGDYGFYPLYGSGFTRRLIYPDDRSKGFAAAMKENGAKYLYFPRETQKPKNIILLEEDVKMNLLEPLGRDVYKLAGEKGE